MKLTKIVASRVKQWVRTGPIFQAFVASYRHEEGSPRSVFSRRSSRGHRMFTKRFGRISNLLCLSIRGSMLPNLLNGWQVTNFIPRRLGKQNALVRIDILSVPPQQARAWMLCLRSLLERRRRELLRGTKVGRFNRRRDDVCSPVGLLCLFGEVVACWC